MSDRSAILRAFLLGAPMEAIALLIGRDAEPEIRNELLELDRSREAQSHQARAPQKKPATRRLAKQKQADDAQARETFLDLIVSTIIALGEPTLAEIHADLEESGVQKRKHDISKALSYLKQVGRIERIGEGHTGRWRAPR